MSASEVFALSGEGMGRPLADGVEIPLLGLGVWQVPDGPDTVRAVRWALEAGYRHLDTAQAYGNEASVGRGLRESGVPRAEVFVTTKLDPNDREPETAADRSLERLEIDRIDLYLVHWPQGGPKRAWPSMERALERGLARSIGVSNFDVHELDSLVASCTTPPSVNQVEFSPFQHRRKLLEACALHDVVLEAYSPLTHGQDLGNPSVADVARRNGRTAAQVLLRWAVQRGVVAIPKSVHRERIVENSRIFDFALSDEDLAILDALDRTAGTGRASEQKWWTRRARAREFTEQVARRVRGRIG